MSIYKLTKEEQRIVDINLCKHFNIEYTPKEYEDVCFEYNHNGWGGATMGTTGYKYTEQQRKNISNSLKGKCKGFSGKHTLETKKKISLKQTGKKASEETKLKMSKTRKGKGHSEETKQKMRELALIREALKRR